MISPLGVRCCWGNTIILDLESPHPCSLRRTRILVGVLAQSVEDDRSPARKWWKERVMSVMALICGSLKHSHMDLQERVLEGKETWEELMDSQ